MVALLATHSPAAAAAARRAAPALRGMPCCAAPLPNAEDIVAAFAEKGGLSWQDAAPRAALEVAVGAPAWLQERAALARYTGTVPTLLNLASHVYIERHLISFDYEFGALDQYLLCVCVASLVDHRSSNARKRSQSGKGAVIVLSKTMFSEVCANTRAGVPLCNLWGDKERAHHAAMDVGLARSLRSANHLLWVEDPALPDVVPAHQRAADTAVPGPDPISLDNPCDSSLPPFSCPFYDIY